MPKGYWIGRVDVTDPERYKDYVAANAAAFAKYGGRFLVRGGPFEPVLGSSRERNVVIEFASFRDAVDCFHSPEYQAALAKRAGGAEVDMVVVEGYDGPQPAQGPRPTDGPRPG
jgi:uncharacterized protein (DUF1330 family)